MIYPTHEREKILFEDSSIKLVGGIDEAGRGPIAGPVVVGIAVISREHKEIEGIRDSKTLSEKQREKLFEIITNSDVNWAFGYGSHKLIDEKGIMFAVRQATSRAYEKLSPHPDICLNDGSLTGFKFKYQCFDKGDRDIYIISMASIIAKVVRDRAMREYDKRFPQYGFAKHKGYGTKAHYERIKEFGMCEIHRRSYIQVISNK
ncbi:MAG TPA: ribonuclease HII [Candidatus Dojkabacteria bacterium]|nr:ribonuclease HII [Candidatus Dojkabacteria bacterium]HQF36325.1 ribonuclease HII [Candidatus Dojkabacteria bacterium]